MVVAFVGYIAGLVHLDQSCKDQCSASPDVCSSAIDNQLGWDQLPDKIRSVCDDSNQMKSANDNKVASIRSVHGKRMTSSVPLDSLFGDASPGRRFDISLTHIRRTPQKVSAIDQLTVADRSHCLSAAIDADIKEARRYPKDSPQQRSFPTKPLFHPLTQPVVMANSSGVLGAARLADGNSLVLSGNRGAMDSQTATQGNVISTGNGSSRDAVEVFNPSTKYDEELLFSSDCQPFETKAISSATATGLKISDNSTNKNASQLHHPKFVDPFVPTAQGLRSRPLPPNRKPHLPEHLRRQLITDGRPLQHQLTMTSSVFESPSSSKRTTSSTSSPVSDTPHISSVRYSRRRRIMNHNLTDDNRQTAETVRYSDVCNSLPVTQQSEAESSSSINYLRQAATESQAASGCFDVGVSERVKIFIGSRSTASGAAAGERLGLLSQSSLIINGKGNTDAIVSFDAPTGRRTSVSSFYNVNRNWDNLEPTFDDGFSSSHSLIQQNESDSLFILQDASHNIPPPLAFSDNSIDDDVIQKQDGDRGSANERTISEKLIERLPSERLYVSRLELI